MSSALELDHPSGVAADLGGTGRRPRNLVRVALLALTALVLAAIAFGPAVYAVDPLAQNLNARLVPPVTEKDGRFYVFGTDAHGRDMLARTLEGMRVSLLIGLFAVASGATIGITLGLVASHFRGTPDRAVSLLIDVQMSVPFLLLALVLSTVLGPGIRNTVIALAVTSWIVYARMVRAEGLVLREAEYVQAARALGASHLRIMFRHLLPNMAAVLIVIATLEVGRMMLTEAALSFLGLGVQPPQASLGRMVAQGQPYVFNGWWFATIPGLAILVMVLLAVFLGDVLRARLERRPGLTLAMDPSLETAVIIGAGVLSGFINTLASSGSAITLPLMIFLGLPANVANGTNRLPILAGGIAALLTFHRAGAVEWRNGLYLSVPLVAGTIAGAAVASVLDARTMGWAVVVAVVAALVMLLSNPKRFLRDAAPGGPRIDLARAVIFFPIGFWAGFIVLDSATYMLLGLVVAVGYDLIRANAIKSLFLVWISLASVIVFWAGSEVNWRVGLLLSAGSVVGSWLGGLLATREWAKVWVFRLLVVVILAEIVQLLHRFGLLRF